MAGTAMDEATRTARAQVARALTALEGELDELEAATRSALDFSAKVRRYPAKTAGLAGGALFLVAGGPGRVLRAAARLFRGSQRAPAPASLLPEEIERAVEGLGAEAAAVKARLEREFAAYLEAKRQDREAAPQAARSFWRVFDTVAGLVGARAARRLAEALFAADPGRPTAAGEGPAEARAPGAESRLPKVDPPRG